MTRDQAKADQLRLWDERRVALESYRPTDPNGDRFIKRAKELDTRFRRRAELLDLLETSDRLETHLAIVRGQIAETSAELAGEPELPPL